MIDFFGCLPKNLKTFLNPKEFIDINTRNNPSFPLNAKIELLPRTLTEIEVVFKHQSHDTAYLDSSKLPPNLTSLDMNVYLHDQTYHMIPQSLRKFRMDTVDIEKLLPFLPAGLESLEINFDGTKAAGQMLARFENLETLCLKFRPSNPSYAFIRNCPTNLKKLTWCDLDLRSYVAPKTLFSDHLTTLELINTLRISAKLIAALPQSVTDLTLDEAYTEHEFAFFSLLPRKLQSLTTNLNIVEKTSLLPDSLTSLRLTDTDPFDASQLDRLPPKLETLEVNISSSIMTHLPTSLTELRLTSGEFVNDEMIRMLPKGLKHFSLTSEDDKVTDAGIADLPPCLLSLSLSDNTEMTDRGISLLPRSLMSLNVPLNTNFTDECIKHLPPKLTDTFFGSATKITSKSCKDLPRYLQSLSLPGCNDWDPEMLIASKNELPQYIKSVLLGNSEASKTWQMILKDLWAFD